MEKQIKVLVDDVKHQKKITKSISIIVNNNYIGNFQFSEIRISKDLEQIHFILDNRIVFIMLSSQIIHKLRFQYYGTIIKHIFYEISY